MSVTSLISADGLYPCPSNHLVPDPANKPGILPL